MKRFAVLFAMLIFVSPAYAIKDFNDGFKAKYNPDGADPAFVEEVKKAGCNVCHVKDGDKKKVRNEYGKAVSEFLKAADFSKDKVKADPEKAKKLIAEGIEKAGEKKSTDGKTFAEKIKAGTLPATDSGL